MPRQRRGPLRRPVALTSLIDVVFLLLLFFMLSSTFLKPREVTLSAAGSGAGTGNGTAPPLFLRLGPGELLVNGQPVALEAAAAAVRALSGPAPAPVLVSLTDGVTAQRLADLLGALAGLPVRVLG